MQNFSDLAQKKHFKIRDWMDGGRKTGHISETVRDMAKVPINH